MKIALFSDLHLGFGKGTERFDESFENAKKAFEIALSENPDIILLAGDLFDSEIPNQETWKRAFAVFSSIKRTKCSCRLKFEKGKDSRESCPPNIPIISIHGTHEYRSKDFANALDVLESACFIVHIHAEHVEIEKGSEKIAVHGLGGVPEKMALNVLQLWNPKPISGIRNFLILHQSIKDFLPFDDEMIATLGIENLPKDFDLIINGHLHWNSEVSEKGVKLLMPGSTIITQMKKLESEKPKGIFLIETKNLESRFIPLPGQRKLYHETISINNAAPAQVLGAIEERLSKIISEKNSLKPLVRIKLKGTLSKGHSVSDLNLRAVNEKFSNSAIISMDADFSADSFKKSMAELREMQKSKKSISALGLELLGKNLSQTSFGEDIDYRRIFELLNEGENEKVIEIFSKTKK